MKLPKKITPDRIRESIVQVFFNSDIPFEPLVGYLHSLLSKHGFNYTNRPIKTLPLNLNPLDGSVIEVALSPQHFYFNEEVKIQLHQNGSLIFNCVNNYIGWTKFFSTIKNILSDIIEMKIANNFSRIGIRYVSEFPNIDILEKVNFRFEMKGIEERISNGNFRIEWSDSSNRIIVNIGSKLPISSLMKSNEEKVEHVSLIDVDVINQDSETSDYNRALNLIDQLHNQQKMVFFGLLKEEFLNTLNPEY